MASRDAFTHCIRIIVHITFTERLWWARHRPRNTDLSLICWHHHLVGKLENTMGREASSVLGKYTNHSASVEQERKNSTGTKGVSVFITRHSGKVGGGGAGRARIL